MNSPRFLLPIIMAAMLGACAAPDKLCRVRSLSAVTEPRDVTDWAGSFEGVRALLDQSTTGNVNLLYVHGIGWSQSQDDPPFGQDLAKMLARQFGMKLIWPADKELCPRSTLGYTKYVDTSVAGGIMLTSGMQNSFKGDDPGMELRGSNLGCLDRIILKLESQNKQITLYRFFWDDALWNSLEWPLVGYDDPVAVLPSGAKDPNIGYDDLDVLRTSANRKIKNNVITWGLTDAAAYLGPAGRMVREGMGAAICAASSDSNKLIFSDSTPDHPDANSKQRTLSSTNVCNEARPSVQLSPFAIFSHSLGSRAVFDTLTRDLDKDIPGENARLSAWLGRLPNHQYTVYLMANQIPLLAAGRLQPANTEQRSDTKLLSRPLKFVAFSEINDLMTYELVPYFEHMTYLRNRDNYNEERASRLRSVEERQKLIKELGFDVVDVRLSFATKVPVINFARPDEAHSNFFTSSRFVADLVINGLNDAAHHNAPRGDCATSE